MFFSVSQKMGWLEYAGITYDPWLDEVYFLGRKLALSRRAKMLMACFLKEAERVLSSGDLCNFLWGDYDFTAASRNVRSNIQLLRRALPDQVASWIRTVRGQGYILTKKKI